MNFNMAMDMKDFWKKNAYEFEFHALYRSHQQLSLSINEASHQNLLSTSPSTHFRAFALSSSFPHGGDWLNVVPS